MGLDVQVVWRLGGLEEKKLQAVDMIDVDWGRSFLQLCNALHSCTYIFLTHHLTCYTLPVMEIAHSSNLFFYESTINSAQGDIHINNKDSGMHDFRSVQNLKILIDNPIKDPKFRSPARAPAQSPAATRHCATTWGSSIANAACSTPGSPVPDRRSSPGRRSSGD